MGCIVRAHAADAISALILPQGIANVVVYSAVYSGYVHPYISMKQSPDNTEHTDEVRVSWVSQSVRSMT